MNKEMFEQKYCSVCKKDFEPEEFIQCMVIHQPDYKCPDTRAICPDCGKRVKVYE